MKPFMKWFRYLWVPLAMVLVAGIGFIARPISFYNGAMYLQQALTGVENREMTISGIRVHYLAQGPEAGPVVVLVHGLGGRAEDWHSLAPWLVKAGYRVYMPDLPGYGRSEKPATFSYSVPDEAAIVVGFMDALNLKQVDLGGWSMGGWIAQRIASEHPERIRKLMLFDSAGISDTPKWDTRLFTPTTPAEVDQLDALLFPHPDVIPGFVARDIVRVANRDGWVIHRALATMLTGHDATDSLLPGLRMPVLLVWGAQDRIMPLSQGQTIHRLVPQSELDVFDGCGHLAAGQCASRIGPKVVEFVKR
jgi:pimeloyl-ACP methyl ester carboxylesterase